MQVTVAANGARRLISLSVRAATTSAAPSLQMMPAIEFPMLTLR